MGTTTMPCIAAGRLPRTIMLKLVGLAFQAERDALDLLVVLELQLEQLDHLHRRAGGTGDGDTAVQVGLDDLLHAAVADEVAAGGAAVARHHHAVGEAQRHAGGGVRHREVADVPRRRSAARPDSLQQFGKAGARVGAGREHRHRHGDYWPPFCT